MVEPPGAHDPGAIRPGPDAGGQPGRGRFDEPSEPAAGQRPASSGDSSATAPTLSPEEQRLADFMDRYLFQPHNSPVTGAMVLQNADWYGITPLSQLVIMAAETSLGDPKLGGTLARRNNFGCMRYHGAGTAWGLLSDGRIWVAGKDWYSFATPQVGMAAWGRYLEAGSERLLPAHPRGRQPRLGEIRRRLLRTGSVGIRQLREPPQCHREPVSGDGRRERSELLGTAGLSLGAVLRRPRRCGAWRAAARQPRSCSRAGGRRPLQRPQAGGPEAASPDAPRRR